MLAEDAKRLEQIDKLYALRLDQYVSLPMIIVVGDQSSGKSSVLEGMTELPLPRDSALCTRFPTQIVFKRSKHAKIEVSIMPLIDPDEQKAKRLQEFSTKHSRNAPNFDPGAFVALISDACEVMGVSGSSQSFSQDVLKIEMSGPQHEHFSVVDLPGLFRKPTPGQTTKEDMHLVKELVRKYLINPRSIILAVVPANVDIATQEIIQMAEDADSLRRRTLGVLTKPDLVDKGAEDKVLEMVKESSNGTGLGYIVVCNRSQSQLSTSLSDRHAHEKAFFENTLWKDVPRRRAGISALKIWLNDLLVEMTRQHFHNMRMDIDTRLGHAQERLAKMGRPRTTASEQRMFLLEQASIFQSLTSKAVDAYYGRDQCFRTRQDLRLATAIMSSHQRFSKAMYNNGLTRHFSKSPDAESNAYSQITDGSDSEPETETQSKRSAISEITPGHELPGTSTSVTLKHSLDKFDSILLKAPELKRIFNRVSHEDTTIDGTMMEWISHEYHNSKGFEVATVNPSLLPSLFFEQARPWRALAFQHVQTVIGQIHSFLKSMLEHVCNHDQIADRLWERLMDSLLQAYSRALSHTEFLLDVEINGNPITVNHYLMDNWSKLQRARMKARLGGFKSWTVDDNDREPLLRLSDTLSAFISNEDQIIQNLHDILKSYCKVVRKRFVDAVCKQAVDHFLICARDSPLWAFSPQFVGSLSEEELAVIAGETGETCERRRALGSEIDGLESGKRILNSS